MVDLYSNDVSVPIGEFGDLIQKNKWTVVESRLYVDCPQGESVEGHLFDLFLVGIYGHRVTIPVLRGKAQVEVQNHKTKRMIKTKKCATNLLLDPENRMVIGKSILDSYDVIFDGPNRYVIFSRKDAATDAGLAAVYAEKFPTRRYILDDKSTSYYEAGKRRWEWKPAANGDFYFAVLPTRHDDESLTFELHCMQSSCHYQIDRVFKRELSSSWTGTPSFSINADGSILIQEKATPVYFALSVETKGDRVTIRIQKKAFRTLLNERACKDGTRLEFLPYAGNIKGREFMFTEWPPVLRDGQFLDLFNFGWMQDRHYLPSERWICDPEIRLNANNALIISSNMAKGDFLPEREIIVDNHAIRFVSPSKFRYCLKEPVESDKQIILELNTDKKRNCKHEFLLPAVENLPDIQLRGSTGRFSLLLTRGRNDWTSLPSSLTKLEWIGDPSVTFQEESRNIVIAPLDDDTKLEYELVVSGEKVEFIAKRRRFIVNDPSMLQQDEFEFSSVTGTSKVGEFMLNLHSGDPDGVIAFTVREDGTHELLFSQIVTGNGASAKRLFEHERTELWYGEPVIDLYAGGQMVIRPNPKSNGVFTVGTIWISDTDMILQFVPAL